MNKTSFTLSVTNRKGTANPLAGALAALGLSNTTRLPEMLPFSGEDVTAGVEDEWQAAVEGSRALVDLPQSIEKSNFFANLIKRQQRGEMGRDAVARLELYLENNPKDIWENSWVRFPERTLSAAAAGALEADLLFDKSMPELGSRNDRDRFFLTVDGARWIRIPISYLLKLALIQATSSGAGESPQLAALGLHLSEAFISDNTSPECRSFYLARAGTRGRLGQSLSTESALRFLLSQLLMSYSEHAFELRAHGQRPLLTASPLPPLRQEELNDCVPDSFYRELMMSPCLSGWDRGEEKMRYMHLCHEVLSRSQLNALRKLREAGIINNNLVLLPSTSSLSLANNGTHLTLGSRRLTTALADPSGSFGPAEEKRIGDLVIKFAEHFLPLFPGLYSAAPRRMSFHQFHPENALGFLPHELDFTHLRMLWRRWRGKAQLRRFGMRWAPWGPPWLDDLISRVLCLRGDLVPDARLIGYLASLMSTDQSPALDGNLGNAERLKEDLEHMGVSDRRVALYILYRQREYASMGFCGFEGRFYSLFGSFERDLAPACELQSLITALAYQEIVQEELVPAMIPDDPGIESERRQIMFAAALGVPTVFIHQRTRNGLLRRIVGLASGVRSSQRYPGYWRIPVKSYQMALLSYLRTRAAGLINWLEIQDVLGDLEERVARPEVNGTAGRIVGGIVKANGRRSAMRMSSGSFNSASEVYFRETLRNERCQEGVSAFRRCVRAAVPEWRESQGPEAGLLKSLPGDPDSFVETASSEWSRDKLDPGRLLQLIQLLTMLIGHQIKSAGYANSQA